MMYGSLISTLKLDLRNLSHVSFCRRDFGDTVTMLLRHLHPCGSCKTAPRQLVAIEQRLTFALGAFRQGPPRAAMPAEVKVAPRALQ